MKKESMADTPIPTAALILAAGQSKRMQWPVSLLPLPDNRTLLEQQVGLLQSLSCDPMCVVTGAHTTLIRERLPHLPVRWAHNERWQGGLFASLQIGLSLVLGTEAKGCFMLPIGVVGVSEKTFEKIAAAAEHDPKASAIIPVFQRQDGYPIFLAKTFIEYLAQMDASASDADLDLQIFKAQHVIRLPVHDDRVCQTITTQQEWKEYLEASEQT